MKTFIERSDDAFGHQLDTFCDKISTYSTSLGLTTGEVSGIKADNAMFQYVYGNLLSIRASAQGYTEFKDALRNGTGAMGPFPNQAAPGVAPTAVAGGVQTRFSAMIQKCVASGNLTTTMGQDLGIIAPDETFNVQDGKPAFKIGFTSGGHPNLIWKKGKYQGVEIWKATDGINFTKLDKDFSPDFADKTALPATGSVVWYYKMIYLYQDEIAGHWSDVAKVTVSA